MLAGAVFSLGCVIAACFGVRRQQTRADAEKDPLLKAMLTELDRSMSQLQLPGFAKPFFIQYRIEDVDDFQTKAEFGASEGSSRSHQRIARITVRVGDYKTDSSGGRGDGALQLAGLDDDPIAIRTCAVGGDRPGLQERAGGLCAEAGGVEAGGDAAAGRRLQQGDAGDFARPSLTS